MRPRFRTELGVFGFFAALAVVWTWPLARHAAERVPYSLADTNHLGWLLSWQIRALLTAPFDMFQSPIFHPFPDSLALSEQLLGGAVLALPAWVLTHNATLVFNTVLLATFPILAFGAYLLVRDLTGWRVAGVVAGFAFAFSPYLLARPTHVHVYLVMWVPYALVFLRRFLITRSWRHAFGLAAAVWLQLVSSMHGFFILLVVLPVAAFVLLLGDRKTVTDRRLWLRGAVAGAVLVVAALPFAMPYLRIVDRHPEFERQPEEVALYSGGRRGLLAAPYNNRLYGGRVDALGEHTYAYEKRLFPGVGLVLLAGAGAIRGLRSPSRRVRSWTVALCAMGLVAVVMSFGTTPGRGGVFGMAQRVIPGLDAFRVPGRFATVTNLALAGLAGIAFSGLRGRDWQRVALGGAVAVILVAESVNAPWPLVANHEVPAVYEWVAEQPADEPLLELPTGELFSPVEVASWTFQREARFLLFQTKHWRPILNGYSSNSPPTYVEMVTEVQGFPDDRSLAYLREVGVRHVIVHRRMLSETHWEDVETSVLERDPSAVVLEIGDQFVVDISLL